MDLPTIDVTADQKAKIMEAFDGEQKFLAWLASSVTSYVVSVEANSLRAVKEEEIAQEVEIVRNSLPEVPEVVE